MTDQLEGQRMRASVLHGVEHVRVEEREVPTPAADEVLVRIEAVGLCGSDVHYYRHGRIGSFVVEQPMVLGHESAGVVTAVGSDVDPTRVGQRVSIEPQRSCRVCAWCKRGEYNLCPRIEFYATPPIDGSFAEYATIQADFAHPVPDSMSMEAAALLEPLSVGIATARKAGMAPGRSVLIAGCGPIGLICAQVARAYGVTEVVMTDLVPARRERALQLGATEVLDPAAGPLPEARFDAFVDATGALPAVRSGIMATAPGGTVVLVGMGEDDMSLPVGTITSREISVTGIFRYNNTWPTAIALVQAGLVDLDSLVTARYGLDDVVTAIETDTDPGSLKSVIVPGLR
ncbi:NAD(P)-dependent alcohol dehydrogenase [Auraticoccus monumenti]|uniref:L-iditol 2-dehydrogenase n=1 Tax=Auraticoccus monumenti TaxID=675864 RepID=A0A1G6VCK8_9ACTN|nr:NAD(P)-dependent alcohol dehydrogenase [Auraticoccus monumenti]SDD50575.1 L-iditol 2-dehydrogenase [Auraticoccus monumenti]